MDQIAVLIPCYNEEKTVQKVVRDFQEVLPEAVVYVYDNNSTDRTVELAEAAGAGGRHEDQQGKGDVIRRVVWGNGATDKFIIWLPRPPTTKGLWPN